MNKESPLIRNVAYNFLSQVWFLVLPLAASPYIVRQLGVDAFGVLSLASAVIGYLAILDLGMGTATIKYIADYYAEGDFQSIAKVIGTSIVIYTGLGLVGTIIILATANLIVTRLLQVPVNLVSPTLFVFYLSSLGFLVNMPLTVFNAIPNALQRFDILVKQNLVLGTVATLGQVVLLALGYSLKALISLNVVISAVGVLVFVVVSRRLLPGVSFRPVFDVPTAKRVLRFSSMKVISIISGHVVFQLDKLLVATFLPLASVTYYVVSLSLAQKIITVIPNVTTAVFPAVSEFKADKARLNDLYFRVSKAVLLLVLPMAVALLVFADKVLGFWMGPEFATHGAAALKFMVMAFLLASFAAVPDIFAGALGRPGIPAFFSAIGAVLNLGLALLLIPRYGISGPALALLGGGIAVTPAFIHRVNRKVLNVGSLSLLWVSYAKPFLAAALLWLFFTVLAAWPKNLVQLGGLMLVGSCLYVLFCLALGALDSVEKQIITSRLRGLFQGPPKIAP